LKTESAAQHPPRADEIESMSNDEVPTRIHALKIGAQAAGALALGALAIGALAVGALAIGRLVIGRSRIRRLEIDELVVARLHVTNLLTMPSTAAIEDDRGKKQKSARFNQPTTVDRTINKLFGLLVGVGLGLPHNYLLQVRGRTSGRIYSTPVDVLETASDTWWRRAGTRSGYATPSQAVRYRSRKDGDPRNSVYVYFQTTKSRRY
jgi:hypothetical protein